MSKITISGDQRQLEAILTMNKTRIKKYDLEVVSDIVKKEEKAVIETKEEKKAVRKTKTKAKK